MKEYIVQGRSNSTTKTGSPYAQLKVTDGTDTLTVSVWDMAPEKTPAVGQLVKFALIKDNMGKKSCSLPDVIVVPEMPDESHPLYNLIPRPIRRDVWDKTMEVLAGYCQDQQLTAIIQEFGHALYEPYSKYPAATTIHHAYPGGLLNHTHQMLHMLEGLYPVLPYPIKIERCIIAILFHDYGKLREYDPNGETQRDMYLMGHVYMSAHTLHNELEKRGVPKEETKRIVHCVLAHHMEREYGSPVVPCTQEAAIVTYLDNISARVDTMENSGDMEHVWSLGTNVIK